MLNTFGVMKSIELHEEPYPKTYGVESVVSTVSGRPVFKVSYSEKNLNADARRMQSFNTNISSALSAPLRFRTPRWRLENASLLVK